MNGFVENDGNRKNPTFAFSVENKLFGREK